jgi:hypothetical protein
VPSFASQSWSHLWQPLRRHSTHSMRRTSGSLQMQVFASWRSCTNQHHIRCRQCSTPSRRCSQATRPQPTGKAQRIDLTLSFDHCRTAVRPWIPAELLKNQIGGKEREKQEIACGVLADWLASELPSAVAKRMARLVHPDGVTYFDLTPLDSVPGYMEGSAVLSAWLYDDGTFRRPIEYKASKATARLQSARACCYLIGLDIEDAFASTGRDIASTLLGPLCCSAEKHSYRPVLLAHQQKVADAEQQGRGDLLQLAHFDRTEQNLHGTDAGLYFEPGFADVTAILALYYTNAVQFVPNPFSRTNIDPLRQLFPAKLTPISRDELCRFTAARSR